MGGRRSAPHQRSHLMGQGVLRAQLEQRVRREQRVWPREPSDRI